MAVRYEIQRQMMKSGRVNYAIYRGERLGMQFEFRTRTKLGARVAVRRFKRVDRKPVVR
jgi:hypothetical protein